jgi:multiple antibiotic resistance protein
MTLLKPLIARLPIVNPIGVVPFLIHFRQAFNPEQRAHTLRISSLAAVVVIAVSALAGLKIIEFFGIWLASFQVGGACLLLISSLAMLNAQPAESKPGNVSDGQAKADAGASIAMVPLTMPLLTGPATLSTRVSYAEKTPHLWQLGVLVGYGVVIGW